MILNIKYYLYKKNYFNYKDMEIDNNSKEEKKKKLNKKKKINKKNKVAYGTIY